jgi:hypothetical protein
MTAHSIAHTATGILLALASTLALADGKPIVVRGEYFYNFEFAYITPEGKNEQWCTKGDMSKAELPDGWGTTTVEVQGYLSPKGQYGNLGTVCKTSGQSDWRAA